MYISVVCKCGKRFRAKEEHAGKRTKCPACGAPLTMPAKRAVEDRAPHLGTTIPVPEGKTSVRSESISSGALLVIGRTCAVAAFVCVNISFSASLTSGQLAAYNQFFNEARRGGLQVTISYNRGNIQRAIKSRRLTQAQLADAKRALEELKDAERRLAHAAKTRDTLDRISSAGGLALILALIGWGAVRINSKRVRHGDSSPVLSLDYAGFATRFGAFLIDGFLLAVLVWVVLMPLHGASPGPYTRLVLNGIGVFIPWLYFAILESSSMQGTLGKTAVGIRVVDMKGYQLSFTRAAGRHMGKWLSVATFFIGFLMAAFTDKNQALHDKLAGCLVVK